MEGEKEKSVAGFILLGERAMLDQASVTAVRARYGNTEQELVRYVVRLVKDTDPG